METFEESCVERPCERKCCADCCRRDARDWRGRQPKTFGFSDCVLASNGLLCLRFTCKGLNLVYRVKAYNAVLEHLKYLKKFTIRQIFFVGRSLGARAASALARQLSVRPEDAVAGLVCLSFPLHPPGQTHGHRQRSEDLWGLPTEVPVLFLSGTVDNMCEKILLEDVVKEMRYSNDCSLGRRRQPWADSEGKDRGVCPGGTQRTCLIMDFGTNCMKLTL